MAFHNSEFNNRNWMLQQSLVMSIVVSAGDDLLARRPEEDEYNKYKYNKYILTNSSPEEDGVLELRSVASLHVAERRVRLHDALLTEILQAWFILHTGTAIQSVARF